MSIDGVLRADSLTLGCARTHISTLSLILIGYDEVVLYGVQDLGPIQSSQVTQVRILLDPHRTPGDIHQTVEAHFLQLQHLINHKSIVEEEVVATDHSQVGKKIAESVKAINPEQQHVVGHNSQLWVAETFEVLSLGLKHEQNLQVALDNGAVLQGVEIGHIVPDVLALTDWKDRGTQM